MIFLIQKTRIAKRFGILLILLLTACISDQHYKCQVNGNEEYLNAPSLHAINSPYGVLLPLQNHDYEILPMPSNGAVGKELNICPPND